MTNVEHESTTVNCFLLAEMQTILMLFLYKFFQKNLKFLFHRYRHLQLKDNTILVTIISVLISRKIHLSKFLPKINTIIFCIKTLTAKDK